MATVLPRKAVAKATSAIRSPISSPVLLGAQGCQSPMDSMFDPALKTTALPRKAVAKANSGNRSPVSSPALLGAQGCQSPMDSMFDPNPHTKMAPCQSPMDRFFEPQAPAFFQPNVAPPPMNYMMPNLPSQAVGVGPWPGIGFMQMLAVPNPAGVAPAGQAIVPSMASPAAPAFMMASPMPTFIAPTPPTGQASTTPECTQRGTQHALPANTPSAKPGKKNQREQRVDNNACANEKPPCPTAVYIDLTCLKEKK